MFVCECVCLSIICVIEGCNIVITTTYSTSSHDALFFLETMKVNIYYISLEASFARSNIAQLLFHSMIASMSCLLAVLDIMTVLMVAFLTSLLKRNGLIST